MAQPMGRSTDLSEADAAQTPMPQKQSTQASETWILSLLHGAHRPSRPQLSRWMLLEAFAPELATEAVPVVVVAAFARAAAAATAAADRDTVRATDAGRGQRGPGLQTTATERQQTQQVSTRRPRMPMTT